MRLLFESSSKNIAPAAFSLVRGVDSFAKPAKSLPESNSKNREISVRPGDFIKLTFDDQTYDGLQKFLKDIKWQNNLSNIKIYVSRVMFSDGTIWAKGSEVIPDPNNPRKLIPIIKHLASTNYEYKDSQRAFFVKSLSTNASNTWNTRLPTLESPCTRAAEVYLEYCFDQCYSESYTPYQGGDMTWQWAYVPCMDGGGNYCGSYIFVREVTYAPCN
jgi:hypothetical protein